MSRLRTHIKARHRLLEQVKKQVEMKIGRPSASLRAYARPYEKEAASKTFQITSKAHLLTDINRSQIVYGSDFHAFSQAQRTHLKILRSLVTSDERPVIIAMEALPKRADRLTAQFVRGECSEAEYLKKIRWDKDWGFPWEHYRPLFDLARDRGFQIIGLNENSSSKDLRVRDRQAAERIAKVLKKQKQALMYVIFGEWHLAEPHLPKAVSKAMLKINGLRPPYLKIYLNCENIYFALAKKGLTETDVVRLSSSRKGAVTYCVLSSPPWVQWQSYLMFLDHSSEIEMLDDTEDVDYTDRVSAIIDVLSQDVDFQMKKNDLTVYSPRDEQIWTELRQRLPPSEARVADAFIESGKSFLIPQAGVIYLARASVNTASEMAGQYVHARISKRKTVFGKMPLDFERLIWIKAVGYFLSKLINPKRQAKTLRDLQNEALDPADATESKSVLRLALDQRMSEIVWSFESRKRRRTIRLRQRSSYDQAARILGDMLGERLYLAIHSRSMSQKRLMTLLKFSIESREFSRFYQNLVAELEPVAVKMKDKKERL